MLWLPNLQELDSNNVRSAFYSYQTARRTKTIVNRLKEVYDGQSKSLTCGGLSFFPLGCVGLFFTDRGSGSDITSALDSLRLIHIVNPLASQKKDWILTLDAFDRLLGTFDADRDTAGQKYEIMRRKLSEFFEARGSDAPLDQADETINRVSRRLLEGEQIHDLNSYFYGVARLVWLENLRSSDKQMTPLELAPTPIAADTAELEVDRHNRENRLTCLEVCLAQLSATNRALIVEYYREEKGVKIEHRKRQAEKLNTSLNGLRLRASRIRSELSRCIHSCIEQGSRDTKSVN